MEPGAQTRVHDRRLLLWERRSELLDLREVQSYGRDAFGDPDFVSIYGLAPGDWYARGIRLFGRTAVECTRDRFADLIGRDVAAVALTAPAVSGSIVVDLFAGSGNTLYWITRHVGPSRSVGFELDDLVFNLTRKNLSIAGVEIDVRHQSYERGLKELRIPNDDLVILFVSPPWGEALDEESGLDFRRTTPPVAEIVDRATAVFDRHKLLFAIQAYEHFNQDSLDELTARFQSSAMNVYDINAQAKNPGLLLGTVGWTSGEPEIRLATYGSLAPGRPNHGELSDLSGRWLVGHVHGSLVEAGWGASLGYPGLILDPAEPPVEVHVFESRALLDHWDRLDAFEGSGYRRVAVDVSTDEGVLPASIYVLAEQTKAG
ncbi:MAG TPA: gamma-glutamylcyclotransferase [Solirubrobacteraceae bacterium]